MNSRELKDYLQSQGFDTCRITLYDSSYGVVTWKSMEAWYKWAKRLLWLWGIRKWEEQFDCDKFSRWLKACATVAHWKSSLRNKSLPDGVAIGTVAYQTDSGEGHMILLAVTGNGCIFIEPQKNFLEQKELSQTEKDSIWELVF